MSFFLFFATLRFIKVFVVRQFAPLAYFRRIVAIFFCSLCTLLKITENSRKKMNPGWCSLCSASASSSRKHNEQNMMLSNGAKWRECIQYMVREKTPLYARLVGVRILWIPPSLLHFQRFYANER